MDKGDKVKWVDGIGHEQTGVVDRDTNSGVFMIPVRTNDDSLLKIRYIDLHLIDAATKDEGKWKVFRFSPHHNWKVDTGDNWFIDCGLEGEANAHLIVAAVNACASVNPDNPQTVAESINNMYEALKGVNTLYAEYYQLKPEPLTPEWELVQKVVREANKSLAKAEVKK